ncbi:MAG: hypothetical protein L0027_02245 [Candidatus Rokubacteria bacterium]|nr:hypothetical protein [Candidatus Rokubacteria bacterium]
MTPGLLSLAPCAEAADLPITVIGFTSPVPAPSVVTLDIMTSAFALCEMTAGAAPRRYRAPGFSDSAGRVGWRWHVNAQARRGQYPVVVVCTKGTDRGELKLELRVSGPARAPAN